MNAKHTPGPWHTKCEGLSTVYIEAHIGGGWVQEVAACGPTEKGRLQQEANARLIAAAPDLLEALLAVLPHCGVGYSGRQQHTIKEKARAAIAKATGETR